MLYFSVYRARYGNWKDHHCRSCMSLHNIYYVSSTSASLELYFSAGMGISYRYGIFCPECLGLGSFLDKGIFCILKQNA